MTDEYLIAILIVIMIIVCIWHYRRCHQGDDQCGIHASLKEGLHCDCARTSAAAFAWENAEALPRCDARFRGIMPYKHPDSPNACASPMYNPFWPPYSAVRPFAPNATSPYIDVPISRMVGDHVPLE